MQKMKNVPMMTSEKQSEIEVMIKSITDSMKDYLDIDLLRMELKGKAYMGDNSANFARVSISHAVKHPEFALMDFDPAIADKILTNYERVNSLCKQLEQLTRVMDNNCRLMGTDVMEFANNYYLMVKRKAAKGNSDAEIIFEDLSARYQHVRKGRVNKSSAPPAV